MAAPPDDHELLDTIKAAPRGRRTAAFFDFDGTLIDGYSAMAMMQHRWRRREMSPLEVARLLMVGIEAGMGRADFERFMRVGVGLPRPPGRRHGRDGREADAVGARRRRCTPRPGSWSPRTAPGPHRRRRDVGAAVPGRAARARARRRPRALHAARGARRRAHRRGRRPDPLGPRQGRRGEGVRQARTGSTSRRASPTATAPRTSQFLETVGRPTRAEPDARTSTELAARARLADRRFPRAGGPGVRRSVRTAPPTAASPPGSYAGVGLGLLKRSRRTAA